MLIVLAVIGCIAAGAYITRTGQEPSKTKSSNVNGPIPNNPNDTLNTVTDFTTQHEVQIDIIGTTYIYPHIRIKKGTTVTWTNQDDVPHNAMRSHDGGEHAHSAPAANQVRDDLFAGPLLSKGQSYSFIFNKVETVEYHSSPDAGALTGSIIVVD